jgi:hypothetical protein
VIARERMSVRLACSIVDVSTAGYYAAVSRPLVARSVRHAWLTDLAPLVRTCSIVPCGSTLSDGWGMDRRSSLDRGTLSVASDAVVGGLLRDHDHCEICHQGFSERYDGDLLEGWACPAQRDA